MRRITRVVGLVLLIGAAFWAWTYFFPSAEKAIRKRLDEVAALASFPANEGDVAKFQNVQKLMSFCTPDIQVSIDAYGQHVAISSRDELFQAAMYARTQQPFGSLQLQFVDPVVTIAPNKETAFVEVTVKGSSPKEKEMMVQECKFTFQRDGRSWLIRKVETVKTLSL
jgi:hypothetical protein